MSEDARKNCRTQGKYSDKGQHYDDRGPHKTRDKRLKVSPGVKEPLEKKFHKRKSNESKGPNVSWNSETESPVRYEENSEHTFSGLEETKKLKEICDAGRYSLSQTENGESFVIYEPQFFEEDYAWQLFDCLREETDWQDKNIVIHGEEYPQPRRVAWYGPFPYSYSGATLEPATMPEKVLQIKKHIEEFLRKQGKDIAFNSVLLNLYRHGKDSVSWHSDDELSMGVRPTIASISLGEIRKFEMKRKLKRSDEESNSKEDDYFVNLNHGSLIIMDGCMQQDWLHRVPKEYHDKDARINLTFRTVYEFENMPSIPDKKSRSQFVDAALKKPRQNHFNPSDENFPPLSSDTKFDNSNNVHSRPDYSSCLKSDNKGSTSKERTSDDRLPCHRTPKKPVDVISASEEKWDGSASEESWDISTPPGYKTQKPSGVMISSKDNCDLNTPPRLEVPFESNEELNRTVSDVDSPSLNNSGTFLNNLNDDSKNAKVDMVNKNVHSYSTNISSMNETNADANSGTNEESGSKESYGESSNSPTSNVQDKGYKAKNGSTRSTAWNVEAKEFVPQNVVSAKDKVKYSTFGLENLLNYNPSVMDFDSLLEYSFALKERVNEKLSDFKNFEQDELSVLCAITDGSQTPSNQKIITERIVDVVKRAFSHNRFSPRMHAPHGSSRQSNYGNQYRHSENKYHSHKRGNSSHRYS